MPNYQIRNLETGEVLTTVTRSVFTNEFSNQIERAQLWAKKIGQRFAVFGQPFFPDANTETGFRIGEDYSSELYVAEP